MLHNIYFDYGYDSTIKERINLIKECGFDGIFIFYDKDIEEKVKYALKAKLNIETIHLPFTKCNSLWLEGKEGDEFTDLMVKGITEAGKYQIKTVIIHITSKTPPKLSEIGFLRINTILEAAKKNNVFVALENLRSLEYLDAIYERYQNFHLKFCFDIGHASAFTKNLKTYSWDKYMDKVVALHLHDNDLKSDLHFIVGDGLIDFAYFARMYKQFDLKLPLTSEAVGKRYPNLSEKEFLIKTKKRLVELERLIGENHE